MKTPARLASLVLPIVLLACQEQRSTGTSTETENAVVARSFPVDSILPPVLGSDDDPVVATLRLDASSFDFSSSRADGRDLDVVGSDDSPIAFDLVAWEPTASRGRLRIRIDPWLRAEHATIKVRSGLPPARRSSSSAVWKGIPADLRVAWSSVLVDDFETGNLMRNRLPDSSFWFLGGSIMNSGIASASSGRIGSALRLSCNANQCGNQRGLLAATMVSKGFRSLRSLDSIELWARGSGRLWVTLESLDSIQIGRLARGKIDSIQPRRAWSGRIVGSSWARLVVRPEDFDPADGQFGNVGWLAMRDSVNYVSFLLDGSSEIWIDDIRFHGIVADDLR